MYTHESGKLDLLLCIFGVLPCKYAGNEYRIPVEFWIPKSFPREPPISFVRPTVDMLISPSNNVDVNGRIFHPLIAYWHPEQSSLTSLASELVNVFSAQPPVYAKPPQYTPSKIQEWSHQSQGGSRNSIDPGTPPPAPSASNMTIPTQNHLPEDGPVLPPKPPKPPQLVSSLANRPLSFQNTGQSTEYSHRTSPFSSPGPPSHPIAATPIPHVANPPSNNTATDILDMDIAEPPPQLPPNPQKQELLRILEERLEEYVDKSIKPKIDIDDAALTHTKETLDYYENCLEREKTELDSLSRAADDNSRILSEKINQARKLLVEDISQRKVPHVDEIITTETTVYNQLYDLVSEDRAIDDTLFALQHAFDLEKIKLETFMKLVRTLAREQFVKKALWVKISEELGLQTSRND